MVEVKLIRSDLPATQKKSVRDAVRVLWERHVEGRGSKVQGEDAASAKKTDTKKTNHKETVRKSDKWADFSRALKASLDKHCKPHWHVYVGSSLGFACKKRNQTMGVFRVGEGDDACTVIVYQSPGIEIPEALDQLPQKEAYGEKKEDVNEATEDPKADDASPDAAEEEKAAEEEPRQPVSFKVLEPADSEQQEEGTEVSRVIHAVQHVCQSSPSDIKAQELAALVRKRLTALNGPIWHVLVGQGESFAAAVAEDRRNYVLANVGTGKSAKRLLVFQHEQFINTSFEWKRILAALPYLCIVLFCMSVLTTSVMCETAGEAEIVDAAGHAMATPAVKELTWFQQQICGEQNETRLYTFGACAVATLVFFKGKRMSTMKTMKEFSKGH